MEPLAMQRTHRKANWLGSLLLSLILAACNLPSTPVPGLDILSTRLPTITQAQKSPNASQALTPAANVAPGSQCVTPKAHPGILPASFNNLPGVIATFLNAGATPDELAGVLRDARLTNPPNPVVSGDVNGDGFPDLAISVVNPASTAQPQSGELLVFTCTDGAYRLGYTLESTGTSGAPAIQSIEDLNADGKAEIVTGLQTCGAHTCFTAVQVLGWTGDGFQNRLIGRTDDLPYPRVQINLVTEGGIAEIVIQGGMIASVGAGPQRMETRTWTYDQPSGNWTLARDELAPSNYRIHVLQDADASLHKGDVAQALVVYNWVLSDQPPLQDYQDPSNEKLNLGAYAAYKIAAIHLKNAESEPAQQILNQMERSYPEGTGQHAFVEMALAYQLALGAARDVKAACDAVTQYGQAHQAQVLDPLGPVVFGYANKSFGPQDLCP
jgi:hypothetical protein